MRKEGREELSIEAINKLYANGVSIKIIAKSLIMTEKEVQEIVKVSTPAPSSILQQDQVLYRR